MTISFDIGDWEKMKKIIAILAFVIILGASVGRAFAGVGAIQISPYLPAMVSSPASFTVSTKDDAFATDPHIFLVMTESCYNGLQSDVKVNWTYSNTPVSITITAWTKETVDSVKVPPDTVEGAGYTVSSLQDHLGTTGPIYWAFAAFLSGQVITTTPLEFTVTLPSSAPKMLVYVLGIDEGDLFDMRVPPTNPGFVVPEPATIILAMGSFGALALYAVKRRKHEIN